MKTDMYHVLKTNSQCQIPAMLVQIIRNEQICEQFKNVYFLLFDDKEILLLISGILEHSIYPRKSKSGLILHKPSISIAKPLSYGDLNSTALVRDTNTDT